MEGVIPVGTLVRLFALDAHTAPGALSGYTRGVNAYCGPHCDGRVAKVMREYSASAEVIAVVVLGGPCAEERRGRITNPARWCGYRGPVYCDWPRIAMRLLTEDERLSVDASRLPAPGVDHVTPTPEEKVSDKCLLVTT